MGKKNARTKKKTFKGKVEKGETYEQELSVTIDTAGVLRKKDELFQAVSKRAALKEEIAPTQNQIGQLTKKVEQLRKDIESKTEVQMVKCREELNWAKRIIQVRRLDTNKLVPELEQDMTDDDRNVELPLPDKGLSSKKGKTTHAEAQAAQSEAEGKDWADSIPPVEHETADEATA
jgi:hypothetical protein